MASATRSGYSSAQIGLHWIIAAFVIFQLLFGEDMSHVRRATARGLAVTPTDIFWADVHYYVGIAVLALVLIRLVIRFIGGAPEPLQEGWMGKAAALSHVAFYILLIAAPILGLLAYYLGKPFGGLHELCKPALIILIGAHAAAALFHQLWLKDGTLRRIFVPGR
jgi:cytochrome b561